MDTKKNNNKLIMYIMIAVLFDFVVTGLYPVTAKADEIGTYTEVQIAANIPNGFQEDIVVTLKSDFSENKYQVVLNTGNNYRSSLTVISNTTYSSSAAIKTSKYKIHGLQEKYTVDKNTVYIEFSVNEGLTQIGNQNVSDDLDLGVDTDVQQIYTQYIQKVSFVENNEDYKSFLSLFSNAMMKKYFLQADDTNTDDLWNKMTVYEKFNYYMLYIRPKTLITGTNAVSNTIELKEGLESERQILNKINGGDKVIEAIETVWIYEWNYYNENGQFLNLYAVDSKQSIQKHSEPEQSEVQTAEQKAESDTDTKEKRLLKTMKNNIANFVMIGAVLIIGIVLTIKNKNEKE